MKQRTGYPVIDEILDSIAPQAPDKCLKCGHEIRLSDNEGGTCEARIVLEQAELGVETTVCGCFCETPFVVCAQCEANARYNEAGGYPELAEECRAYCRRGHKKAQLRTYDRKARPLVLDDRKQNFAGVATIRAAISDLLDAGWQCGNGCDIHHPWNFPTEMFPGDAEPTDSDIELRSKFVNAVIDRISDLQSKPHEGIRLENLCPRHKVEVLPKSTASVCAMCQAERGGQ